MGDCGCGRMTVSIIEKVLVGMMVGMMVVVIVAIAITHYDVLLPEVGLSENGRINNE